ncbi:MAG: phosphotransferase system lactose/cellobiose-specific subunit [Firmicutes bacterium]|nr:phosphotransferase system lactose/cellobiose-specific subunit [Bacillota bacterium]
MKVLLVCSGGMSSAIVVKAIEKEAAREGLNIEVKAVGTGELEEELKNGWELVLAAPQVRHRMDEFCKKAEPYSIPVAVIPPQGYTPFGGAIMLTEIKKIIG